MPVLSIHPDEEGEALEAVLNNAEQVESAPVMKVTNCLVADPHKLLQCIVRCTGLRELHCASTGITFKEIVQIVLPNLKYLNHLEFTLEKRQSHDDMTLISSTIQHSDTMSASMLRLYVEVVGKRRTELIRELVKKMPKLVEVHVHFLRGTLSKAVFWMERIWLENSGMHSFTVTSEVPPEEQREPPADRPSGYERFRKYANVCGNLLLRRNPPTRNCFRLRDLAVRAEPLRPAEPMTVVVNVDESTHEQMGQAGVNNRWDNVHGLCLVLVGRDAASEEFARAGATLQSSLVTFFGNFRSMLTGLKSLKELNVSSFHFGDDLDFTQVLSEAGLTTLTGLSVTPCGIWHEGAIGRLANTCTQLDDLDVRMYTYRKCPRCEQPLELTTEAVSQLNFKGRLTFVNVFQFSSLNFLRHCQISELRMYGICRDPPTRVRTMIHNLRHNELLHCLVLNSSGVLFTDDLMQSLAELKSLRLLCLKSPVPDDIVIVTNFIKALALMSSLLKVIHVHFTENVQAQPQRYTWVRKHESPQQLLLGDAELQDDPEPGRLFTNRPCVVCSVQTFIGLMKPHYKGARTTL
ncbi:hypothetical protein HPB50_025463 [Hyalomma asiaticum]|uniref:Uncharacterized protein n=1 Tax=Hyalomma asiaticum TaxID=266040 RepID=A0ACB7SCC5_HYAAI|nr:hypothetical protein HPB50_025463 [Hyalomma asiaticum]